MYVSLFVLLMCKCRAYNRQIQCCALNSRHFVFIDYNKLSVPHSHAHSCCICNTAMHMAQCLNRWSKHKDMFCYLWVIIDFITKLYLTLLVDEGSLQQPLNTNRKWNLSWNNRVTLKTPNYYKFSLLIHWRIVKYYFHEAVISRQIIRNELGISNSSQLNAKFILCSF